MKIASKILPIFFLKNPKKTCVVGIVLGVVYLCYIKIQNISNRDIPNPIVQEKMVEMLISCGNEGSAVSYGELKYNKMHDIYNIKLIDGVAYGSIFENQTISLQGTAIMENDIPIDNATYQDFERYIPYKNGELSPVGLISTNNQRKTSHYVNGITWVETNKVLERNGMKPYSLDYINFVFYKKNDKTYIVLFNQTKNSDIQYICHNYSPVKLLNDFGNFVLQNG